MNTTTTWLDCGDGILNLPSGPVARTRVVELKDFGRIFEVYDYSNDPEANFRLILAAPKLLTACIGMLNRMDTLTTEEFFRGGDKAEREAMREAIKEVGLK